MGGQGGEKDDAQCSVPAHEQQMGTIGGMKTKIITANVHMQGYPTSCTSFKQSFVSAIVLEAVRKY